MRRLDQLLEETARSRPEGLALRDPERGASCTYRELDRRSARYRDLLADAGIEPGDRVGILAEKSIAAVAAIFGVLKAGAAYLPLDPAAPASRNATIATDARARGLLGERRRVEALLNAVAGERWRERSREDDASDLGLDLYTRSGPAERVGSALGGGEAGGDRLAYILYTSGSTGRPKGVPHTHAGALSFLDWCSERFAPRPEDRFSSHAPFHFDLSILDLFLPVRHGACLVLVGEALAREPLRLAPFISREGLTVWYSTPSILRLMVEYGKLHRYDCDSLRLVLFAGEVFPLRPLRRLRELWSEARFFNLYGPTETNVCTFHELPMRIPEERSEPFPIGAACSHCRTRVVDRSGREAAPGAEGELLVRGAPVMEGYWNLPERTHEAFTVDTQGRRWYRTGDLVRERPEGGYDFLGRRDRMVKRLGCRVELGEVEVALHRHPRITEAAVVALPSEATGVRLVAFLGGPEEARPSVLEMKRFCAEALPSYMVPDRFCFERTLPMTATGKTDYQRLEESVR